MSLAVSFHTASDWAGIIVLTLALVVLFCSELAGGRHRRMLIVVGAALAVAAAAIIAIRFVRMV